MANFEAERRIERRQLFNRLEEIQGTIFTHHKPLTHLERCVTGPGKGPEPIPESGWEPFEVMQRWGHLDQTTWFRMRATVTEEDAGKILVAIIRPCTYTHIPGLGNHDESGEGLAYVNGEPFQGIDRNHDFIVLSSKGKTGEVFEIALECTPQTRFDATHCFTCAEMAVMHQDAWDFYHDGAACLELIETLSPEDTLVRRLQTLLSDALYQVDLQHIGEKSFFASLHKAQRTLQTGLKAFEARPEQGVLTLMGHSHIDTAWLWPLRETRRKVGRTWSTVLRLLERYPDFVFAASQPALYRFAKENHPKLYAQIKKRAQQGRWDVCGASWVEQDNNVPSGEALVRQFLYGNRFYEQEFGLRSRTAWLPDAFGFPWSMPQIMKKCQIDYFFTTKISWSQFTEFPYGYFDWKGVDGTAIRAIMPQESYNGNPIPKHCIHQRESFQEKELLDEVPFPFGWGDGGGGPSPKMIEYAKRYENIYGVPRCQFGRIEDCFDRMAKEAEGKSLPVWNDELYLELHRGCQTTQAQTKKNNRTCEFLLQNTEFLATLALLHGGGYEQQALNEAWCIVLTNQFHDILPGSSITEVYEVAAKDYDRARALVQQAWVSAQTHLDAAIDTEGPGTPLMVFNPLSWMRTECVQVQMQLHETPFHIVAPDGAVVPSQKTAEGELLFLASAVPPKGYAVYHLVAGESENAPPTSQLKVSEKHLENDYLRIKIDKAGRFTSVYDKFEEREILPKGEKGNILQFFDDRPGSNDAWDIDHNFECCRWEAKTTERIEVVEKGPLRAVVRVVHKTDRSTITQDIILAADAVRVDVATHVDWYEKRTLLKVAFPVDILSPRATYHIQFGSIERNTHENTDWDRARFEVPAHHWADLSEGDYGVALLNDCKYGYDVKDNTLRLSLLRSPVDPDPHADEGEHTFTYALCPHGGDWREGVVQQGFELNQPLLAWSTKAHTGQLPPVYAFADIDVEHVILDTVKKAEDSNALILRLYESYGQRGKVNLSLGQTPLSAVECDMMEENEAPVEIKGNTLSFSIKPYEIRTFKITF